MLGGSAVHNGVQFMSVSRFAWLFLALVTLTSIAPGQQPNQTPPGTNKQTADDLKADDFSGRRPADGPWYANHEMRLRSDGNLPGQLRAFDVGGNLTPVRARLFFIQNGQIIGRATADERGQFQAVGLEGGAYSVVAAGPTGFGAFSLRIIKNNGVPNVTPPKVKSIGKFKEVSDIKLVAEQPGSIDPLALEISVVSPTDFPLVAQIIRDQVPGLALPGAAAPGGALGAAGAAAAVGGGGGGGLGGILGAGAALGGIGGLLGASHNNATASDATGT